MLWWPVSFYCQSQSQSLSSGLWILDFVLGLGLDTHAECIMFNVASPVGKEVEGSPVRSRLAGLEHGVPRPEHGVVDSLVIQCSSKSSINIQYCRPPSVCQ